MTDNWGNHPKSHLQHWGNQLWLRPRVSDRPFSEAGNFSKPSYSVLARFGSLFFFFLFWYPACLVQTLSSLSVVETWAVLCPKASFAKKKTSSKQSVFLQCSTFSWEQIGSARSNCVSRQQNPKLFKCHVVQFFEVVEDNLSMWYTILI